MPFNCKDQGNLTWWERAELCADLLASLELRPGLEVSIADIGCGDQKLLEAIRRRGLLCRYQGYDLLPQDRDVVQFDVRSDVLPNAYEVVALLGVVEYLEQVELVFASLARQAPWLLLSHVIQQGEYYTAERLAELGWRNHLTSKELIRMLDRAGLTVVRRGMTSDNRTLLLACRSRCVANGAASAGWM